MQQAIADMVTKLGPKVPKSAKAILGTTKVPLEDKNFIDFGLEKGIVRAIQQHLINGSSKYLNLQIGIDGIPIFNSSGKLFWPLLCRVTNAKKKTPFCVSIYYSDGKPKDFDKFLEPFISEYILVKHNGISVEGLQYHIKLHALVVMPKLGFR